MSKGKHNWARAQPHHVVSGKITRRKYAEANPKKVEWVTVKKTKNGRTNRKNK